MNINELRILFEQECKAMKDLYEVDLEPNTDFECHAIEDLYEDVLEPNIDFECHGYISMETTAMFHLYEVAHNHGVQIGIQQQLQLDSGKALKN